MRRSRLERRLGEQQQQELEKRAMRGVYEAVPMWPDIICMYAQNAKGAILAEVRVSRSLDLKATNFLWTLLDAEDPLPRIEMVK